MADDERNAAYRSSPPGQWGHTPHIYPHSSHGTPHGTPSQEFSGFGFTSPQIPMEPSAFSNTLQQRPSYQQLQPLMTGMPQWPSMLNQSQPTFQPVYHQPVDHVQSVQSITIGPSGTPLSAISSRSAATPRKTLTDLDRKRMCQYAEEHPNSKQTEIGAIFGVERSTVSKVLRQKEKYLLHDDGSRSPIKRAKGRSPDIERALANWAKNQEKKGVPLTDEHIRDKARYFAATTTNPEIVLSASWIEKFKLKNNLMGARSRKASLAPDDADAISASQTPGEHSPISQQGLGSPSSVDLRSQQSQESLKTDSPSGYYDFSSRHGSFQAHSAASLNSAFTDAAPPPFSPGTMSPTSPFFTPDSGTTSSPFIPSSGGRPLLPATANSNAHRPRSQTFPLLEVQYLASAPEPATPKYIGNSVLGSPLEDHSDPLVSIGQVIGTHELADRPATVSPAETMRPPPLPAHILQQETKRESTPVTTPEEAQRALEVVLNFFQQQPHGFLDLQESVTIGKLMEKLKLQSRGGST